MRRHRGPLPDRGLPTAIPTTSYSACHLAMQFGLASDPAYVAAPPLCYMLERLEEWVCAELQPNKPASYGAVKAKNWAGHRDCILRFLGERSVATRARASVDCSTARHGAVLSSRLQAGWPYRGPRSEPPPCPGWVPLQASATRS